MVVCGDYYYYYIIIIIIIINIINMKSDSILVQAVLRVVFYCNPMAKTCSNDVLCVFSAQTGDVIGMPVPSSWNDVTQNVSIKNYIGWVWYDREVWVPAAWKDGKTRIMLRFESAHYNAIAVRLKITWFIVYYTIVRNTPRHHVHVACDI